MDVSPSLNQDDAENIGIILVHGIGEQGRFEHLDNQIRGLINALRRRPHTNVTVEIRTNPAAAFQAAQENWKCGPDGAVCLWVEEKDKVLAKIHFHEVWWADVNETYSVIKELRFWIWGLSLWTLPRRTSISLPTSQQMFVTNTSPTLSSALIRIKLFTTSVYFVIASILLGVPMIVLSRLFNVKIPNFAKIFANYISSVKLYNQRRRAGRFFAPSGDFLDTIGEPPRISVRRRMIRTIADVATRNYDRWYILAHSQGSVVAFNGLMEPALGWPGFLDSERWLQLCDQGMAGPQNQGKDLPKLAQERMIPARPIWAKENEIVYRTKIFGKFRGLLTYGSPLEKFAAIWPARVPVCREKSLPENARWINVFDPIDPVSGIMKSWPENAPAACPKPLNIGYAVSKLFLRGHVAYLDCPEPRRLNTGHPNGHGALGGGVATAKVSTHEAKSGASHRDPHLADLVAKWILDDNANVFDKEVNRHGSKRFFKPGGFRYHARVAGSYFWWLLTYVMIAMAAGGMVQWLFADAMPSWAKDLKILVSSWAGDQIMWITTATLLGMALTLAVGLAFLVKRTFFDADKRDYSGAPMQKGGFEPCPSPDPASPDTSSRYFVSESSAA